MTSHNLRELEDICDHVGLLHKGGVILSKDLEEMKTNIHKIQCVLKNDVDEKEVLKDMELLNIEKTKNIFGIEDYKLNIHNISSI